MKYNSLRLKAELDRADFDIFDADGSQIPGKRITHYQTHEQAFRDKIQSVMTDKAIIIKPALVEIALDIWGDREEVLPFLADMVANSKLSLRETRGFLPYAKEMRRPKCKGETIKLTHRAQLLETLQAGGTLYLGNQRNWGGCKRSPVSVRAYWKMTDGQEDDKATDLELKDHRGRFEIVIQRDGLTAAKLSDITDWQSWTGWGVTKAAKHFAQLVPDADPAIKALGCRTYRPRPGARRDTVTEAGKHNTNALRAYRRQKTGSNTAPRLFSGRSNLTLNRAILDALKVLDRRLKRGSWAKKVDFSGCETPP